MTSEASTLLLTGGGWVCCKRISLKWVSFSATLYVPEFIIINIVEFLLLLLVYVIMYLWSGRQELCTPEAQLIDLLLRL